MVWSEVFKYFQVLGPPAVSLKQAKEGCGQQESPGPVGTCTSGCLVVAWTPRFWQLGRPAAGFHPAPYVEELGAA